MITPPFEVCVSSNVHKYIFASAHFFLILAQQDLSLLASPWKSLAFPGNHDLRLKGRRLLKEITLSKVITT